MKLEENGKHMPKQTLIPLTLREFEKLIRNHKQLPRFKIDSPCGSECMT
jgi:hypothetical protein